MFLIDHNKYTRHGKWKHAKLSYVVYVKASCHLLFEFPVNIHNVPGFLHNRIQSLVVNYDMPVVEFVILLCMLGASKRWLKKCKEKE